MWLPCEAVKQLYDQGDIYKSVEAGTAPCGHGQVQLRIAVPRLRRPSVETRSASSLSKYQDWLIQYIEIIRPSCLPLPSEMMNGLWPGLGPVRQRTPPSNGGFPSPSTQRRYAYGWTPNYISALGYGTDHDELYRKYWPANVHMVGKEIVRFHTIIWPIMLHALGLPLPKQVFGHGWLVIDGKKRGKSGGNVVDPVVLCNRYSSDAVRYFLMREMPFGSDGEFTLKAMLTRINADLANDLGNLVSRTVAMIEKYFGGEIPAVDAVEDVDRAIWKQAEELPAKVEKQMDSLQFSVALQEIWKLIGECNKYIDVTQPWVLGREEAGKPRLRTVLYTLAECVRRVAALIGFVMPRTPARIYEQLGVSDPALMDWASLQKSFGVLPAGLKVHKGEALFPRLDIQKELERDTPKNDTSKAEKQPAKQPEKKKHAEPEYPAEIEIDDFFKCKLQVARVMACEKVEKSKKLLKFQLSLGKDGTRTVVSGIAQYYTPEELVGRQVVLISNLKTAKLAGIESQGMILSAVDAEDHLKLVSVQEGVEDGAIIG